MPEAKEKKRVLMMQLLFQKIGNPACPFPASADQTAAVLPFVLAAGPSRALWFPRSGSPGPTAPAENSRPLKVDEEGPDLLGADGDDGAMRGAGPGAAWQGQRWSVQPSPSEPLFPGPPTPQCVWLPLLPGPTAGACIPEDFCHISALPRALDLQRRLGLVPRGLRT